MRKWIIVVLFLGSWLWSATAFAVSVYFDFDDGLDPNFSFYSTPSGVFGLYDTGGKLLIMNNYIPSSTNGNVQGGYVQSNFQLVGDFWVEVRYLINYPGLDHLDPGIQVQLNLDDICLVRSNESGYGNTYYEWSGSSGRQGTTTATYFFGQLGFMRVGNQLSGYVRDGGGDPWTKIWENEYGNAPTEFTVTAQVNFDAGYDAQGVYIDFDDFYITADDLDGYVPIPPAILLLGSGLIGLGLFKRRTRKD